MHRTLFPAALAAVLLASGPVLAAPYAMVTDLKGGEPAATEAGKPKKLALLGYLEAPTEVKLEGANRLTVTYFANGTQYTFAGPARVALEPGGAKVLEGAAAEAKKVAPEKAISGGGLNNDQWRRLQQATVVMRNVKTTFAVVGPDKAASLSGEPALEWTAVEGARRYRVTVYGADSQIVHEAAAEQNSLRVPAGKLQPGVEYRWKVDAIGVAKPVSAQGTFTVADAATRERIALLKPAAGADFAVRAFYAAMLTAEGFSHDARAEWRQLAKEFPDEPAIRPYLR